MPFWLKQSAASAAFLTTCMVVWHVGFYLLIPLSEGMQTPQGFIIENGHLIPQDWLAIIFNPSFPGLFSSGEIRPVRFQ